jgi:sugar/nucleoside kinase (ribokinase family)
MQTPVAYPPIDYLAIGHVCRDLAPGGHVTGGAVAYTTAVARALGCRAGIVTSAAPGETFPDVARNVAIQAVDAAATTIFENVYDGGHRRQVIHAVAGDLSADHVPPLWARAPMVHIGPIANEIDPAIITLFSNSIVCAAPQGWMRRWDERGRVYQVEWETAAEVLPLAAVTVLSTEDLAEPSLAVTYAGMARLLVVTDGPNGCMVYYDNEARAFAAPSVQVTDLTGAGDTFAAAYLVRLFQTDGDVWEAAEFANRVAARSVTRRGLAAKAEAIHQMLVAETRQPARRY